MLKFWSNKVSVTFLCVSPVKLSVGWLRQIAVSCAVHWMETKSYNFVASYHRFGRTRCFLFFTILA